MKVFEGKNGNELYPKTLKYIKKYGNFVCPRNKKTIEIYPAVTIIKNPKERVLTTYGRGGNIFFLVAEALWILAGRGDSDFITFYCKELNNFKDEGYLNFHGAYGSRLRNYGFFKNGNILNSSKINKATKEDGTVDQLEQVYEKFSKDKETRQAVVCFWNPYFDNAYKTADIPCNNLSYYKIRDGKLHLHQILRSNDVNLGLYPTNLFQFSMQQEALAGWLGIEVGEILFFSDSLHFYIESKITDNVLKQKRIFDIYKYYKTGDFSVSKSKFNIYIKKIFELEKEMKNNKKSMAYYEFINNKYWNDLYLLLVTYNYLKLERNFLDYFKRIENQDLKVAGYEFLFRYLKKQGKEMEELKEQILKEKYPKEIWRYIEGEY